MSTDVPELLLGRGCYRRPCPTRASSRWLHTSSVRKRSSWTGTATHRCPSTTILRPGSEKGPKRPNPPPPPLRQTITNHLPKSPRPKIPVSYLTAKISTWSAGFAGRDETNHDSALPTLGYFFDVRVSVRSQKINELSNPKSKRIFLLNLISVRNS